MSKLFTTLLILSTAAMTLFSGCKKKCDLDENTATGAIKADVSIYPESGYITSSWTQDQYHITASHPKAGSFKVSTDGGMTKSDVDYNQYSILCYPMNVNCVAQFEKNVLIDDVGEVVKYTIKVKDCGKCDQQRYVENFVAIRAIPDTYTIIYDVDITTVE